MLVLNKNNCESFQTSLEVFSLSSVFVKLWIREYFKNSLYFPSITNETTLLSLSSIGKFKFRGFSDMMLLMHER